MLVFKRYNFVMIVIHVLLAVASLGLASYNFFKSSNTKLNVSYGLAVGTLASGVSLIFINNASVLRTCMTGVIFFAVVTVLNELTRKKLTTNSL